MLTTARLRADLQPATLDWISALKTSDLRTLLKPPGKKQRRRGVAAVAPLRPEELVPDAVAEITSPAFPGERLLVCLNPRLRDERARKREDLLQATEAILAEIARVVRRPGSQLRGRDRINRRVGRDANRRKVEKHFTITVTDDDLTWARDAAKIAAEARLDGIYVVRTSLAAEAIGAAEAVEAYKSLARVEQAFRAIKTARLKVRPVYVYNAGRVRATCSCACSPTTSSGTCADASPRCCSRTTTGKRRGPSGPHPYRRPRSPTAPSTRPPTRSTPTGSPCTA